MHTHTRRYSKSVLFALLLIFTLAPFTEGCRTRAPLTPQQQVVLTVNQALATLGATNRAVITDVVAVNKAGFLNDATTRTVLTYCAEVNKTLRAAMPIQKGATSDVDKATAIKALFAALKLPPEVSALLNSTQVDASVVAVQATIKALQDLVASITVTGGAK
jgi:hypothetical protein